MMIPINAKQSMRVHQTKQLTHIIRVQISEIETLNKFDEGGTRDSNNCLSGMSETER